MELTLALWEPAPLLGRAMARVVQSAGAKPLLLPSVEALGEAARSRQAQLIATRAADLPQVLPALDRSARLLVLASEQSLELLAAAAAGKLQHIFGLRYPDGPPRPWELLAIVRRYSSGAAPLGVDLGWGSTIVDRSPASSQERDAIVAEVETWASTLCGERTASSLAEVAHELLMNAMYDAPVDGAGAPKFAHDRTASISLSPAERPRFRYGCDGTKLVLAVEDPFGRLRPEHVFGGLHRALESGSLDRSGGGAGLGFLVMHRACTLLFFDVVPNRLTRATAILELDVPQRELRRLPRSIHFFTEGS